MSDLFKGELIEQSNAKRMTVCAYAVIAWIGFANNQSKKSIHWSEPEALAEAKFQRDNFDRRTWVFKCESPVFEA